MRPQWWDWCAAARRAAATPGEYATAMSWASLCWDWRRAPLNDAERSTAMTLVALSAEIPGRPDVRTLQRHLAALVGSGLLEVTAKKAPGRPQTYAPTLPNTGHQSPENTGRQSPENTSVTGHGNPEHRTPVSPAPFSSEIPDSPLAPAHTHTHAREDAPTRGAEIPPKNNPGDEHIADLLKVLDIRQPGMASRVAPGYRHRLARGFMTLESMGWRRDDLIDRLLEGSMRGVGSPGAVLLTRLQDLATMPPPVSARGRADERAKTQARGPCDHGTPGGCGQCFMCRRGQPDEDGVLCRCTAAPTGPPDEFDPPGYTPPLFPDPTPEGTNHE